MNSENTKRKISNETHLITTSSERLNELLKEQNIKYKSLTSYVANKANVSYTAARKWLMENSLPRTRLARIKAAEKLEVDLYYWEYGRRANDGKPDLVVFQDNYNVHLNVKNDIRTLIDKRELVLSEIIVVAIEVLAVNLCKHIGTENLNDELIDSLIDLAILNGD